MPSGQPVGLIQVTSGDQQVTSSLQGDICLDGQDATKKIFQGFLEIPHGHPQRHTQLGQDIKGTLYVEDAKESVLASSLSLRCSLFGVLPFRVIPSKKLY